MRIAVTIAGARRKLETYIGIQVLGPNRIHVIPIVEECGEIISKASHHFLSFSKVTNLSGKHPDLE